MLVSGFWVLGSGFKCSGFWFQGSKVQGFQADCAVRLQLVIRIVLVLVLVLDAVEPLSRTTTTRTIGTPCVGRPRARLRSPKFVAAVFWIERSLLNLN
jgi:hypothetical protein